MIMKKMRWSWKQLQETPAYVKYYVGQFLSIESNAEANYYKKMESKNK